MWSVECGVWSFLHRHGDATGKPETRDETRGCRKTSMSCETPPILTFSTRYQTGWNVTKCHACHDMITCLETFERRDFAASPIDTATPQENQRLETRHVGGAKRAFRARLPPIFTLCSFKIDVFLRVFVGTSKFATSKSMLRARLQHISQNATPATESTPCATWRSLANAICKKHATRHV